MKNIDNAKIKARQVYVNDLPQQNRNNSKGRRNRGKFKSKSGKNRDRENNNEDNNKNFNSENKNDNVKSKNNNEHTFRLSKKNTNDEKKIIFALNMKKQTT